MKRLFNVVFLLLFALFAQGAEEMKFNFTGQTSFADQWVQTSSSYYQPLGKVELTPDGVKLTANSKTVIIVGQKNSFPVHAGDQIELTIQLKCEKNTYVYLGLYEYNNRSWVKNDIADFWVKPGTDSVTKTITVKPGKAPFNRASVVFGVGTGKEVLVKGINMKFVGVDSAMTVKPELPKGVVLHFDGSNRGSMKMKDGKIEVWRDLSGNGFDMTAKGEKSPLILNAGLNRLPMVRFSGKQELKSVKPLNLPSGITVFVMFRREVSQANGENWQDSLYWGDGKNPDNTGRHHLTMGSNNGEELPKIFQNMNTEAVNAPFLIGSNAGKRGFLKGDIGEIIVLNRTDMSTQEIDKIRSYLLKKWNVSEDDYVRFGKLPEGVKRITDSYPLSDQANNGKWRKVEEYSDEFNGSELNRKKWTDQVFYSIGGAPVRVLPDNLKIKDGMAQITTIYDPNMPSGRLEPRGPEYHSFSTGMMQSVFMFRYGYLEARTKIQPTSFNNAFWMIGRGVEHATGRDAVPEIDIYELAGKSFAHSYAYNMALHYVQHKPVPKHYAYGKNWKSNFKFTEDFHVYGLEWTPKVIRFYIDGMLVREFKVKENFWELPMTVHFNCLSHFDWFGVPDPADFPCTYYIDYFRLWKNPESDLPNDWDKKYKITHITRTSGFAYDYYKKHGNKIVANSKAAPAPKEFLDLNIINSSSDVNWKPFYGGSSNWKSDKKGMLFKFPAVASRKDNGEVQYDAPSTQWPLVEIQGSLMKTADWNTYQYLAIDFINPNRGVEACTLKFILMNNQTVQQPILLKSGNGTVYWKLPDAMKKNPVKNMMLTVRGSDRTVQFYVTGLRLEK